MDIKIENNMRQAETKIQLSGAEITVATAQFRIDSGNPASVWSDRDVSRSFSVIKNGKNFGRLELGQVSPEARSQIRKVWAEQEAALGFGLTNEAQAEQAAEMAAYEASRKAIDNMSRMGD